MRFSVCQAFYEGLNEPEGIENDLPCKTQCDVWQERPILPASPQLLIAPASNTWLAAPNGEQYLRKFFKAEKKKLAGNRLFFI